MPPGTSQDVVELEGDVQVGDVEAGVVVGLPGTGCLVSGVPLRPAPVFAFVVVLPELVVAVGEAVVEEVQRLE